MWLASEKTVKWVEGNAKWISDGRLFDEIFNIIDKYKDICRVETFRDMEPLVWSHLIKSVLKRKNPAYIMIWDPEAEMSLDIFISCKRIEDLEEFTRKIKEKMKVEIQRAITVDKLLRRLGIK